MREDEENVRKASGFMEIPRDDMIVDIQSIDEAGPATSITFATN
jgi:hypothetical protein